MNTNAHIPGEIIDDIRYTEIAESAHASRDFVLNEYRDAAQNFRRIAREMQKVPTWLRTSEYHNAILRTLQSAREWDEAAEKLEKTT